MSPYLRLIANFATCRQFSDRLAINRVHYSNVLLRKRHIYNYFCKIKSEVLSSYHNFACCNNFARYNNFACKHNFACYHNFACCNNFACNHNFACLPFIRIFLGILSYFILFSTQFDINILIYHDLLQEKLQF